MTSSQWIFHYLEILKFERQEREFSATIITNAMEEIRATLLITAVSCAEKPEDKNRIIELIKKISKVSDDSKSSSDKSEDDVLLETMYAAPDEIIVNIPQEEQQIQGTEIIKKKWLPKLEKYDSIKEMSE